MSHIVFFQSYSQIISRLKTKPLAGELLNNFQNIICFQNTDRETIDHMNMIAGKYLNKKVSEGFSENTQSADKNWFSGGYTSDNININQTYSSSTEDRDHLQKKDFTRLRSFETFALLTDGVNSKFFKLFTKPDFLSERLAHTKILKLTGENEICLPEV